jgi:hypothetical protein
MAESVSSAQPGELALEGGKAIDEVEDHGDAVEVDAEVRAQAGDRDQAREAAGVEAHRGTRPLHRLHQAELDESLDQDRVQPTRAAAASRVRCSRGVRRDTRG